MPSRKRQKQFKPNIKPDTKLNLFEISDASDFEQMKYLFWVKDKLKLYRVMFRQYSTASNKSAKTYNTFDSKQQKANLMTLGSLNKFLNDF